MRAVSPKLQKGSPYYDIVNQHHELVTKLYGSKFASRIGDSQLSSMNSDQKRQGLAEMFAIDDLCNRNHESINDRNRINVHFSNQQI